MANWTEGRAECISDFKIQIFNLEDLCHGVAAIRAKRRIAQAGSAGAPGCTRTGLRNLKSKF